MGDTIRKKRAGESGLDTSRLREKLVGKTGWDVYRYRRDAGLSVQNIDDTTEHLQILKKAWAVDQAISKLSQYIEQHNEQVKIAENLFTRLDTQLDSNNKSGYYKTLDEIRVKIGESYANDILEHSNVNAIETGRELSYNKKRIKLAKYEFNIKFVYNNDNFVKRAKDLFNNLDDAIKRRDMKGIEEAENKLKSERKLNKYIDQGMDIYESAIKKADEETAKIAEEAQREASERAKKRQQEQEQEQAKDNDSMDIG